MFSKFEEQGVMNQKLGTRYRDLVLAPGGSRDAGDVIRDFLQREPSDEAFMRQKGFI